MRQDEDLARATLGLWVEGRRGGGRPRLTWEQVIRADMAACGIDGTLVQYRRAWKAAIRRPGPAIGVTRSWVDWPIERQRGQGWKTTKRKTVRHKLSVFDLGHPKLLFLLGRWGIPKDAHFKYASLSFISFCTTVIDNHRVRTMTTVVFQMTIATTMWRVAVKTSVDLPQGGP